MNTWHSCYSSADLLANRLQIFLFAFTSSFEILRIGNCDLFCGCTYPAPDGSYTPNPPSLHPRVFSRFLLCQIRASFSLAAALLSCRRAGFIFLLLSFSSDVIFFSVQGAGRPRVGIEQLDDLSPLFRLTLFFVRRSISSLLLYPIPELIVKGSISPSKEPSLVSPSSA